MEPIERSLILQLKDEIDALRGDINDLRSHTAKPSIPSRSEQINELCAAIAKAQGEMQVAGLSAENPYFKSKYADLAAIVRASRPHLAKHGLAVMQQVVPSPEGQTILHTILTHSSGQWIESQLRVIPAKNDIQTFGSTLTYLRRYAYAALVGVVTSDEDDDGERAVAESRDLKAKGVALNAKYSAKEQSHETISKDQLDEIEYELAEYSDIAEMVMDGLQIQSLADMPASKYRASITRIREIKNNRNGLK